MRAQVQCIVAWMLSRDLMTSMHWTCSDSCTHVGPPLVISHYRGELALYMYTDSLIITARMTNSITMRIIHSFTFCHHSLRLSLVAVRWNMSAFWLRYSARMVCVGGGMDSERVGQCFSQRQIKSKRLFFLIWEHKQSWPGGGYERGIFSLPPRHRQA